MGWGFGRKTPVHFVKYYTFPKINAPFWTGIWYIYYRECGLAFQTFKGGRETQTA